MTSEQQPNVIVKLRALWFFEKMAQHETIMKKKNADGNTMLKRVFEIVGEKFAQSEEFVMNYQYLQTIYKYMK